MSDTYILYIEDERPVIDLVRAGLSMSGYEVVGVEIGSEGLRLMRERKPSLLLLDLMMPETNGWQIYEAMKADPALADIPVIVVTSKIPEDDAYTIVEGLPPVDDYITKPFDMWRLVRSVEKILK